MDTHTHGLIGGFFWLRLWYASSWIRDQFPSPFSVVFAFALAIFGAMFPDSMMLAGYIIYFKLISIHGLFNWNVLEHWWVKNITTALHSVFVLAGVTILFLIGPKRMRPYGWPLVTAWLFGHIIPDYFTHLDNAHRIFWPVSDAHPAGLLSRFHPIAFRNVSVLAIIETALLAILAPLNIYGFWRLCNDFLLKKPRA